MMRSVGDDGVEAPFRHALLLAWGIYMGESLCFVAYLLLPQDASAKTEDLEAFKSADEDDNDETRPSIIIILYFAFLELFSSGLMYLGLMTTSVSSYQMLQVAAISFTGIISHLSFYRKLSWTRLPGIVLTFAGLVTVGLTDHFDEAIAAVSEETGPQKTFFGVVNGDIIIIAAQVFVAQRVMYEEILLADFNVSLCFFLNNLRLFQAFLLVYFIPICYNLANERVDLVPNLFEVAENL
jgi:drug/metabolite transporter (DMT)-like permease